MAHTVFDGDRPGTAAGPDAARRSYEGPLLVAGDDAGWASGALRVAELLARRDRVNAHVFGVLRPVAVPLPLLATVDRDALEEGRRRLYLERLRQRLHQTTGLAPFFSLDVATGNPATTLARAAGERGSELIIVGLAERDAADRVGTEDAALQVIRAADTPVLAVPERCGRLPKHGLVAMDFSASSQRAAYAALPLLAPGARLTLAYVRPELDYATIGQEGLAEIHEHGVAGLFAQLAAPLAAAGEVAVDSIVLTGEPARALLDEAGRADVDLIATGTQGEVPAEHRLIGSVSTALLRGAGCALLVAPPTRGVS